MRCVTEAWSATTADLVTLLPAATGGVAFVTDGSGLVGWGEFARIAVTGADAAARISRWYAEHLAHLEVVDRVGVPGAGPVCFASLGFSPDDTSIAVIPREVVGRYAGRIFCTRIGEPEARDGQAGALAADPAEPLGAGPERAPVTAPGQVRYADAALSTTGFIAAVQSAVDRIRSGLAAKVVLAHGLTAMTEFPVDERFLLEKLAERYPTCTTFAVGGLVGASPEMLIRRHGAHVTSRVLAGTAWPDARPDAPQDSRPDAPQDSRPDAPPEACLDAPSEAPPLSVGQPSASAAEDGPVHLHRVAAHLLASSKDLAEHAFAVRSVADVLAGLTAALSVPDHPGALELANLTHLVTDIAGELAPAPAGAPSALDLAARLHPTAAVGGTPREVAQRIIRELEPAPRGRYAAPVGWIDARGDGEFAIALRCAEVTGTTVRLMAGCGIVADSDPEVEAREAQIKMVPVRDALEG